MWKLRRMKTLDVDPLVMLDVYMKEIRSVVELAVPAWHSGLTLAQTADIERVQKVALSIILGTFRTGRKRVPYEWTLSTLDVEPLKKRRDMLCKTFAKKTLKTRHKEMFKDQHHHNTRNKANFYEHYSKNGRFYNSPLNFLTRLLNN